MHQPYLKPMDFNIPEDDLYAQTEALLSTEPGFQTIDDFYGDLKTRVPEKVPA